MIGLRAALAVAMIACGAVVLVRVLAFGLRPEILPGVVLGGAMIALGVHRIALILRVIRGAA